MVENTLNPLLLCSPKLSPFPPNIESLPWGDLLLSLEVILECCICSYLRNLFCWKIQKCFRNLVCIWLYQKWRNNWCDFSMCDQPTCFLWLWEGLLVTFHVTFLKANKALKSSHVSSSSCVLNKKKKKGGKNDLWLFVECNDNNTFFVMKFAALHFIFKEIGIKNWSIYVYPMTHIFPSSRVLELKWTISTLKKKFNTKKENNQ